MKKFSFLVFLFLAIVSIKTFAQTPKWSFGGGPFFVNYIDGGGFADIGFLIYNKNSFDLRNHFIFRGGGSQDLGLFSFAEKISLGGFLENKFRSYGYAEGGIGVWGNKNKNFFEMPLTYTFGGGGGTEIFLLEKFCVYFEAGALVYLLDKKWKNGGMFQIGWKGYL